MKVIDAHCHLLPEVVLGSASFYNDTWGNQGEHIRAMDEAGVDIGLLSYPTTDFHAKHGMSEIRAARVYNEAVKKLADSSDGRLRFLAALPVTETDEMIAEARRAIDDGAAGLSLPTNTKGMYPDERVLDSFYDEVQRIGVPVFIHPTTQTPFGYSELRHPLITPVFQYAFDTMLCLAKFAVSGILKDFPGLKLVFASFGGAMPFLAGRFDRTYNMLLGRQIVPDLGEGIGDILRKVYVDTSGADSLALIKLAVEVFGEDRVLWGSDFPANQEVKASIEAIKGLRMNKSAKEKILGGNLEALIG
jgi:predicted TIM-barrel fold metal-dependent hydrolase